MNTLEDLPALAVERSRRLYLMKIVFLAKVHRNRSHRHQNCGQSFGNAMSQRNLSQTFYRLF